MEKRKYLINNYRFSQLEDRFLITTDHGSWEVLEKKEFEELKTGNIKDIRLFKKLVDKGIVLTKDNKESIKEDFINRFQYIRQGTSLHIVVVTLRCNQKCIYCHASSRSEKSKKYDMDEKTAKNTVDIIFQSPSKYITIEFQGGEPLLNFETIKFIVEYANKLNKEHKKDLIFQLVTNLTLMDNKTLDYCIKNKVHICSSLDGPKELHDNNRKYTSSSYALVTNWLRKIQKEYEKRGIKDSKVNALVTVTKESLKYPKEIVNEYDNLGLQGIHLRYMNKLGYAYENKDKIEYEADEFIKFWKQSLKHILNINKKGKIFRERGTMIILAKILTKFDPNYLEMRSPCGAVIGQMAYNYNGEVFCCDEGRSIKENLFKIGDVKSSSYKDMVCSETSSSIISASINDTEICDLCVFKPYCGLCPVCSYAEQGTIKGIIPQTTFCKVFKAQFTHIFDLYLNNPEAKKVFDSWIKYQ